MAGEINWNILDPNAPAKIGASFEQGAQNALAAQSAREQQKMNALALQKAQMGIEDDLAAREAYKEYGGKAGFEIKAKLAEQKGKELAQRKAQIETGIAQLGAIDQLLVGVRDQASYDQAKQRGAEMFGPDAVSDLDPVYNPEKVQALHQQALTAKDRAELEHKSLTDQLAATKFEYQQKHDTAVLAETRRGHDISAAKNAADTAGTPQGFSPAAIENAAARYNIDGTLPPMGMGKSGVVARAAILNRAAELASGDTGEEQRVRQLANKASSAALSKLQAQQTMVGAFERNFNKNADLVLEQSKKVDRTGMPIANKWIQAGKRAVSGDPELSAYDANIKATANEYAKIVSGSMGNAALAEGEIKKVESLLNAAQTPKQVEAVITMMKRETANRMKGFDEEKKALRGSMGSKPTREQAGPPPGATHGGKNPRTGEMEYFDAQGNKVK